MTLLIIALFIVTALLSIPIAHALVLASVGGLLIIDKVPVHLAIEQMLAQTQSFPLIAIPFFMMTGALMVSGKLGQSLVSLLSMMIGRVHGGPAQVGVLSSTIFGGVSGSAVADASAIGSMLIPWLKKLGYPAPFAAGTLAAAATIDILIPPSIPMIVYALVSGASIGALFVAGILPGLLMCAGFMAVCYVQGRRRNFPRDTTPFEWPAFWRQLAHAGPALVMPVLIIVFLRFGIATPTEVSVMSTLYALVVAGVVYRDLTWAKIRHACIEAGISTGVVLLIIMASSVGRLDRHLRAAARGVHALRQGGAAVALADHPGDEPDHAGGRHVHRPARGGAAAHADVRAARLRGRHGHGAARDHDDRQPVDRPVPPADRHHALHHQLDRQGAHRRRGEGADPLLLRRDRPAAGVRLPALADDPLNRLPCSTRTLHV